MSITSSTNKISLSNVDAATFGNGVQHNARATAVTSELHGEAPSESISAFYDVTTYKRNVSRQKLAMPQGDL